MIRYFVSYHQTIQISTSYDEMRGAPFVITSAPTVAVLRFALRAHRITAPIRNICRSPAADARYIGLGADVKRHMTSGAHFI